MLFGEVTRRDWLAAAAIGCVGAGLAPELQAEINVAKSNPGPFRVCLNTSTIRGQKLTVDKQIQVAAQAGFEGIEPWIGDLKAYIESGGKLSELRKMLDDANMTVESAIGFAKWIVDSESERPERHDARSN